MPVGSEVDAIFRSVSPATAEDLRAVDRVIASMPVQATPRPPCAHVRDEARASAEARYLAFIADKPDLEGSVFAVGDSERT